MSFLGPKNPKPSVKLAQSGETQGLAFYTLKFELWKILTWIAGVEGIHDDH